MYGDLIREMQDIWGGWPGANIFEELELMPFGYGGRALDIMPFPAFMQPQLPLTRTNPFAIRDMMNFDLPPTGYNHSFIRQSVVSMSSGPDGHPQVYEETMSTTTVPGGIRETKKTVRDSRTGIKKMAIGHHIGDRSHILEREQNVRSGQEEERQELINLDEDEVESFNHEYMQGTAAASTLGTRSLATASRGEPEPKRLALPSSDPQPSTSGISNQGRSDTLEHAKKSTLSKLSSRMAGRKEESSKQVKEKIHLASTSASGSRKREAPEIYGGSPIKKLGRSKETEKISHAVSNSDD